VDLFSVKSVGIDIYDMPLKAVERNSGIFFDRKLEDVIYDIPIMKGFSEPLIEHIRDKRYWGDYNITHALLEYVNKQLGAKLMKPRLLLSMPSDITHGKFGSIFMRMLSEAGISSGCRQVQLIENVMCAAIGGDIHIEEYKKTPFIYSNEWCTYISIIFANTLLKPVFIDKNYLEITIDELLKAYESLISSLPLEVPLLFKKQKQSENAQDELRRSWKSPVDTKIYLAVPNIKKQEYGQYFDKYSLNYIANYDECIIRGLEKLVQNNDIFKPYLG
jgi:hypothetical protein